MKYQIYLNKDTSDLVNFMAKALDIKPNTFIKNLLESNFDGLEPKLKDLLDVERKEK